MTITVQTNNGQPVIYDKDEVDALIAGVGSGSGVERNTHTHSASGALSIARAAADQDTQVTINADVTSFTDNLNNRDVHHYILINGTAADFTVDLSAVRDWADPSSVLTDALNVYETTVATLLLRKVQGTVYGTLDVPVVGTSVSAPLAVRGGYISGNGSSFTVNASDLSTTPQTGDGILFAVIAPGPSTAASVTYTAPAGATQLDDYNSAGFVPRVRLYKKTYAGESSWTFGSDSGISRVAVVAIANGTTFTTGAFRDTLNPPAVAHATDSIGLYLGTSNFDNGDDTTWTDVPVSHTLVVDNRATVATDGNMQGQIAYRAVTGSGNYNPAAPTFTPAQAHSSVAILVST